MKTLAKLLLGCILLTNLAFSIEFDKINSTMQTNIEATFHILQKLPKIAQDTPQNGAALQQVANQIFALFDPLFDYNLMSQLALSKHYKTLTLEQFEAFKASFKCNLKKNFTHKLKLYQDEKIEIIGSNQPKNNRYNLKTSLIINGKTNEIIFKFYNNTEDWKIYDIDILGISIIQTYRSQINDFLAKSDFNALLDNLRNEISFEAK
ncbi:ABC transporter substrate-binding protein [Helicobacter sp.]|uniref:Tgt2/MlaC family protein n=1 Tax=Helicobacter sp. TaxID=218 RepID=UPI0025B9C912|nr:ABC transporter substrate-binding protein [Helicobacter sp.]MCI5968930.1 ABC transporter substrate-binding protein [Helicobacter sp.]MDY2584324.1 ABC transporter substrate-binding protein [Helicobacter sp.]